MTLTIPAFTVGEASDGHYTYWVVNLHDYVARDGEEPVIQLFHKREDAERFAAEQRGRRKQ